MDFTIVKDETKFQGKKKVIFFIYHLFDLIQKINISLQSHGILKAFHVIFFKYLNFLSDIDQ